VLLSATCSQGRAEYANSYFTKIAPQKFILAFTSTMSSKKPIVTPDMVIAYCYKQMALAQVRKTVACRKLSSNYIYNLPNPTSVSEAAKCYLVNLFDGSF